MKKLAIVSSHPVQYHSPLFRLLAQHVDVKVFYTWGESSIKKYDPGFGKVIEWDIPLLDGYNFEFLVNCSKSPGTHSFNGIKNPDAFKKIKEFQPDAILLFGWAYHSHLMILRKFKGRLPIWFRGDSTHLNEPKGALKHLRLYFLSWVYSHVNKVLYVGSANKAYYAKLGLKENQLKFAPHAVDNDRFGENQATAVYQLRNTLHISNEVTLILFAGKFEENKNPELLMDAFIASNLLNTHILFVGDGALNIKLKAKAQVYNHEMRKRGLLGSSQIHFLPFQNQTTMPIVYQTCDLFCLPSKRETWGLAVNEAMAAGKAILISDKVGCAIDLVKNGINGEIFCSDNKEDLKNKLKILCKSKSHLLERGEQSKKIIQAWRFEKQEETILKELSVISE